MKKQILKKFSALIFISFFLISFLASCQQINNIFNISNKADIGEDKGLTIKDSNEDSVVQDGKISSQVLSDEENSFTEKSVENNIKEISYYISDLIPLEIRSLISEGIDKASTSIEEIKIKQIDNKNDLKDSELNIDFKIYGEKTENKIGNYVLAFVSGFYNCNDNIVFDDFLKLWSGKDSALFNMDDSSENKEMIIENDVYKILVKVFGEFKGENLKIVSSQREVSDILLNNENAFSIIPFENIDKEFKVFQIDTISVFNKKGNIAKDYPLDIDITASGNFDDDLENILKNFNSGIITNKDEGSLTALMMTGCTALVRGTASKMEQKGITYPGEKIAETLKSADITHISNEITFVEGNPRDKEDMIVFSSDPKYIELLRYVGTDVVELTGNHMNDYGPKWMVYTLEMYEKEGWQFFAGGRNLQESYKPAKFNVNGNKIAFLGCNQFGPESYWATEDKAGAAPPNYDDYEKIIAELKKDGYIVIFTFAHQEIYEYTPSSGQIKDFRRMVEAGADIISGSQAHHPQAIEFYRDSIIFYGLGNLFFDQMYSTEVRQGMIAKHIFYKGRHINTVIITTMLEDYCQPRLTDDSERYDILYNVFKASDLKQ
ncbi:MAG: CapA family protein [Actinomycetota bacterium]|nr:CapA family protein [Actinomycetota bacterium]